MADNWAPRCRDPGNPTITVGLNLGLLIVGLLVINDSDKTLFFGQFFEIDRTVLYLFLSNPMVK